MIVDQARERRSGGSRRSRVVLSVAILTPLAVGLRRQARRRRTPGDADISGTATAVTQADGGTWSFLVTGSGAYDKASVTATSDTAWYYRSSGGEVTSIDAPASAADLGGPARGRAVHGSGGRVVPGAGRRRLGRRLRLARRVRVRPGLR